MQGGNWNENGDAPIMGDTHADGSLNGQHVKGRAPIAIVGMGCRFPRATTPAQLWELLVAGENAIGVVPKERFDVENFYDPRPATPGKMVTRLGGFLDDVYGFDADFFRISHREAASMDPQQRLMLEVCAEALDDAFLTPEYLGRQSAGVYVGCWTSDWECHDYCERRHTDVPALGGGLRCLLSGRISFAFDLRGPSLTVDTGCSASLVAVHLACQSLWLGESSVALAGGVNLVLDPKQSITMSQGGLLSPDGQCKAFDDRANGLVRSEGCAAVVLMPLAQAQAYGAPIYAVIRGSGASNDGSSNGLLTKPSEVGQNIAVRAAFASAGVSADDVQYVEAHGTGTNAGDPVELRTLLDVMRARTVDTPCLVGSVKTNLGHSEAAAGMAGLIKTVMAIKHRTIPPNLHLQNPTPLAPWDTTKLAVPTEITPWPEGIARAGVSSFGIAGTNAHLVIEEAPAQPPLRTSAAEDERAQLLLVSAMTEPALRAQARNYRELLAADPASSGSLTDICYTSCLGREHYDQRLAVVGRGRAELIEALDAYEKDEPHAGLHAGMCSTQAPLPVFVFSGQGSQWTGMGRELFATEPVFREVILQCDAALRRYCDWSLVAQLYEDCSNAPFDVVQRTLFGLQVALAEQWRSWGVKPALVLGHSMGEVAAAHVAGALSLEDAACIICRRSDALTSLMGHGIMLAVGLGFDQAQAIVDRYPGRISIAVNNSETSTVLSGDPEVLREVTHELERQDVFCREVATGVPAHSPQLDPLLPGVERALAHVAPRENAAIAMFSTVTAQPVASADLDVNYWIANLRQPVRFSASIRALIEQGHSQFLEIGPHPNSLASIREILGDTGKSALTVCSLRRAEPERAAMLSSLAELHIAGQRARLRALFPQDARFVPLPSYPFQRHRFDQLPGFSADEGPLLGRAGAAQLDAGALGEPLCPALHDKTYLFETVLSVHDSSYLADHAVAGAAMVAGASYVDMAMQAAARVFGSTRYGVEQVSFGTALVVRPDEPVRLQVAVSRDRPDRASIHFYTGTPNDDGAAPSWTLHASASARLLDAEPPAPPALDSAAVMQRCHERPTDAHFRNAKARGIEFGPAFQGVQQLWSGEGEALGRVSLPPGVAWRKGAFFIHPAALDACWQTLASCVFDSDSTDTYLPVAVESVRRFGEPQTELWSHAVLHTSTDADIVEADVHVFDEHGQPVLETRGLRLQRIAFAQESPDEWLYEHRWVARARSAESRDLTGETWLVLADETREVAARLVPRLAARGARCVEVRASEFDPDDAAVLHARVAEAASQSDAPLAGVVDLWPLDVVRGDDANEAALHTALDLGVVGVVHLLQAMNKLALQQPELWIVTSGAQTASDEDGAVEFAQTPVWGLGRTLRYEFPDYRTYCVDLSAAATGQEVEALVDDIAAVKAEDQIALRGGDRFVLHFVRCGRDQEQAERFARPRDGEPVAFRLATPVPGILDNLALYETGRRRPGPGEVEIEVAAAGLNFVDVMLALGVAPDMGQDGLALGRECAGRVAAIGPDVEGLEVGQEVVALANQFSSCVSRFVVTRAVHVAPRPKTLTLEEAGSTLAAFVTAYCSMEHIGRLARGERILIHSATGGVGLAAVQLAKLAGAEIFATAGTQEKRDLLRGLGIQHIYDSRGTTFADEIMRDTNGEGIDMVLNSLAGDAMELSLSVLRDGGRFLEIGKRDVYEGKRLGLLPFKRGLSFSHVDIIRLIRYSPDLIGEHIRVVCERFERKELAPLPLTAYPVSQASDAFRLMAQAKHIGKIVLTFDEPDVENKVLRSAESPIVREDATYLITGGLGGLGLVVSEWLVEQGARNLTLLGRSAPNERAQEVIQRLHERGARVLVQACDISRADEVGRALAKVRAEMPPLAGVIHGAVVLDDGVVLQLDRQRVERVAAAKVFGAFHLHEQTRDLPLDFFVMFSSGAAAIGSPGQGNYAAANEFLDALAHYRRKRGLPALSINWGAWSESGAAVRADRSERLAYRGFGTMTDAEGIMMLDRLMREEPTQVAVLPSQDWHKWVGFYPSLASAGHFEELLSERPNNRAAPGTDNGTRTAVLAAPPEERLTLLEGYLVELVRRVLRIPASKKVEPQVPLNRMGVDSLMAVELKNRMETDLGTAPTVSRILLSTGLTDLAEQLLQLLAGTAADETAGTTGADDAAPSASSLGDAVDRLLNGSDQVTGSDELLDDLYMDEGTEAP